MQLMKCPIEPCPKGELWDSSFEVAEHMKESHPTTVYEWDSITKTITPVEGVEYVPEDSRYDPDEPVDEGMWDWAVFREGSFEQEFAVIFQETFELLVERQKKYGVSNIADQGLLGIFTRMYNDKMQRVKRVLNGRVVQGEIVLDEVPNGTEAGDTLEDALKDIANYSLIMLALYRGVWGKPLMEELDG